MFYFDLKKDYENNKKGVWTVVSCKLPHVADMD